MRRLPVAAVAMSILDAIVSKRSGQVVLYSRPYCDDAVRQLLLRLAGRFDCYVVHDEREPPDPSVATELGARAVLSRTSWAAARRFVRARYVFMTHEIYACAVPGRQVVVNMWHGELTKPTGRWSGDRVPHASWATACSRVGAAFRSAELGLDPSRVLVVGHPRNDALQGGDAGVVRAALDVPASARLVAWLPTYRGTADGPLPAVRPPATLASWAEDNDVVVLARPHPLAAPGDAATSPAVRSIDEKTLARHGLTLYQVLGCTDGLITDVSSVWVDYLLVDRPIWVHFPDLERWRAADGVLLEPYEDWVPARITTTGDELVAEMSKVLVDGEDAWAARRRLLRNLLHQHHDAQATTRLLTALGFDTAAG